MVASADTPLNCYISSSQLVDTTPLRSLLIELGVTPIAIDEMPTAGQAIVQTLESWLRNTSFVCAVLPVDQSANIFFEIGLAQGLGRPVFIIAEEGAEIPVSVQLLPHLTSSLGDRESIRFHLEAFIASLGRRSHKLSAAAASIVSAPARSYGGGEAIAIAPRHNPRSTLKHEQEVADLLTSVSTQVTLSAQVGEQFEADMLIWLRDLDIGQGGPVLVELKSSAKEMFPERALHQITRALAAARLRAAILITGAPDGEMAAKLTTGAVVFSISLDELRREVVSGTFLDSLRRQRNRIFHGAA